MRPKVVLNDTTYDLRLEEQHLAKVSALNIKRVTRNSEQEKDNSVTKYLRIKGKTTIQGQTSQFMEAVSDEVEGSILLACPKHRQVQPGLPFIVKVHGGKVRIPMHNGAKNSLKLYAGTLLASYEVITERGNGGTSKAPSR